MTDGSYFWDPVIVIDCTSMQCALHIMFFLIHVPLSQVTDLLFLGPSYCCCMFFAPPTELGAQTSNRQLLFLGSSHCLNKTSVRLYLCFVQGLFLGSGTKTIGASWDLYYGNSGIQLLSHCFATYLRFV